MKKIGEMVGVLELNNRDFMVGMKKSIDTLPKLSKQFKGTDKTIKDHNEKALKPLKKQLTALGDSTKKFTRRIFNLRTAFLALGVTMASRQVMGRFKDFETALVDMGKVTNRSLVEIRKDVMSLDASLGTSTDLMQGYYQVISAGVKGASNQLDTLTVSSKAAIAAHVSQGEVIKGLTAIVDAYEGKVRDAAEAADVLFTIERLGKTTVAELIPIIGSLASMSATLKVSQDELGGSLAQITKFIGSTAEAGTQLKALYTALITPNEQLNALFKEQGGVLKAIEDIGFVEVLRKMDRATEGNVEALKELMEGRREALLGFLSLAKGGYEPLIANIEEMTKKTGAADRAFKAWKKTLDAIYTIFTSTIGRVMIEMGQEIAPSLIRAIMGISNWLKRYQDTIVSATRSIVNFLPKMVELVTIFITLKIVSKVTLLFQGFMVAIKSATGAVLVFNKALKANLFVLGGLIAIEFGMWFSKFFDGTAKAERGTKEWTGILKTLKERLDEARKSTASLTEETQKWLDMHEKWDKEAGEIPILRGLSEEQQAKFKEVIDEINDYYNKATMDRYNYEKLMLDKENALLLKYAGMRVDILREIGATGKQITSAEKEEVILIGKIWEAYFAKLKKLNAERGKSIWKGWEPAFQMLFAGIDQAAREWEDVDMAAVQAALDTEDAWGTTLSMLFAGIDQAAAEWGDLIEGIDFEGLSIEALTAIRNMYEDMRDYGTDYFDTINKLIEIQKKKYKDLKINEALIDKWAKNEKKRLYEAQLDMHVDMTKQMTSDLSSFFEYAAKENKRYFRLFQLAAIATATIDTVQSAIKAYKWAVGWGGPIAGAIAAAIASAAGFARVALIKAQKYAVGGWLDEHPKGGKIKEGTEGKDDVFLGATPGVRHWAMRNERVFVMNKEEVKKFEAMREVLDQGLAGGGWIDKGYGGFGNIVGGFTSAITGGWGGAGEEFRSLKEQTIDLREEFRNFAEELASLVGTLSNTFSEAATIFRERLETAVPGGVIFGEYFQTEALDINIEPMQANIESIRASMEDWAQEFGWTEEELERQIQLEAQRQQALFDTVASVQEVMALEQALAAQEIALEEASQAALQEVFDTLIVGSEEFGMLSGDVQTAIGNMVESGEEDIDAFLSYWTDLTGALENVELGIADMLGEITPLDSKIRDVNERFNDWISQLEYLGVAQSEILALEERREEVLAHIIAEEEKRIRLLNIGFMQDLLIRKAYILGADELAASMELVIRQEQELADAIEQGASDSVIVLMEEVHAMEAVIQETELFTEEIRELASTMVSWGNIVKSVQDQILSIMTTMATSPLDTVARLDLLWEAIDNFGEVTTPEAVSELQGLYSDMLGVAAEAYQRPSVQYQEQYAAALEGLGALEDIAEDFLSDYEIQVRQLEAQQAILDATLEGNASMVENLQAQIGAFQMLIDEPPAWISTAGPSDWEQVFAAGLIKYGELGLSAEQIYDIVMAQFPTAPYATGPGMKGYQLGTDYVPRTGLYTLHKGEKVIPFGERVSENIEFNLSISIDGAGSPKNTGIEVENRLKRFLRSSPGRAMVKQAGRGRV